MWMDWIGLDWMVTTKDPAEKKMKGTPASEARGEGRAQKGSFESLSKGMIHWNKNYFCV